MAGRGFPPAPDSLKLLKGLPGRRPLRGQAPTIPDAPLTEPTELLDPDGLAEWRRLAPILCASGLATPADAMGLTVLCGTWGTWAQIERRLSTEGVVVVKRGVSQPHPLLKSAAALATVLRVFLCEFGCTPGSRSRIRMTPAAPESRVDAFRRRHGDDLGRDT